MTTQTTTLWVAGHGLRGYMPESSPYLTTSWESAKDSTLEDLGHGNGLADYYCQGLPQVVLDWLDENHTHRWGELRNSRFGMSAVRDCTHFGCSVVNAYDDEDDPKNERGQDEAEVLWEFRRDGRESELPFTLDDYQWDMVKELAECEEAIRELKTIEADTEWDGWIGNNHYWISMTDRAANEIPPELEGEELEAMVEELNEQGW